MDLTKTPKANRCHISFFGCTNAGKSSLVNAFVNQKLSVVSQIKGTTTDPVIKSMELLPFGPVVVIDTAGIDDDSELGNLRIEKTNEILNKTDLAILVVDSTKNFSKKDEEIIEIFKKKKINYIIAYNKSDLIQNKKKLKENEIYTSAINNENIRELRDLAGSIIKENNVEKNIIIDKLNKKDKVILVVPIDESAPKGRLILPQQMVLRELLDNHNSVLVVQVEELEEILSEIKPKLVITDSQAFNQVKEIVPEDILLTSFSILFARYKGELKTLIQSAKKIKELKENAKILISEGCTHHRQCNDIGTVKIPRWLKEFTKKEFDFHFTQGFEFPTNLSEFDLIIHCGGCMLNEKEMKSRIEIAKEQNIPIVNYGIFIAYINGILNRALEIFPEILGLLNE